jgi:glycosyltransferase involved in cell wall biosynthesis
MVENLNPLVSILLPTYNAERYLSDSIKSILDQTYNNLELIIIDDASTDHSKDIILAFKDKRIRYYKNDINSGIVKSLNKAIELSNGTYLFRMDADDISVKNRIEIQIFFLEKNINVGVLGTNLKCFGKNNNIWKNPTNFDEIKTKLFFDSAIWHPTVAIRKSVLVNNNICYDPDYEHCEDYKMWYDLSKVTIIRNIDKVLLMYRVHDNNHSRKQPFLNKLRSKILTDFIDTNKLQSDNLDLHNLFMSYHGEINDTQLEEITKWTSFLSLENEITQYYSQKLFEKYIKIKLNHCLIRNYYTKISKKGGYKIKNIKYLFNIAYTMILHYSFIQTCKEIAKFLFLYRNKTINKSI